MQHEGLFALLDEPEAPTRDMTLSMLGSAEPVRAPRPDSPHSGVVGGIVTGLGPHQQSPGVFGGQEVLLDVL